MALCSNKASLRYTYPFNLDVSLTWVEEKSIHIEAK